MPDRITMVTVLLFCCQDNLEFPGDSEASSDAVNLMQHLLTGRDQRLCYDQIVGHNFFTDVDFDNIRQSM